MDINVIEKEIKENKLRNAYIFYGEDEGMIKESINAIVTKLGINKENVFEYSKLNGQELSSNDFVDGIFTIPFMTSRKLIEVIRADFFAGEKSYKNAEELIKLTGEFIEDPPENIYLIMYYITSLEKKDNKVKALEKKAHRDKSAVIKMPNVKKNHIGSFLEDYFKEKNITISKPMLIYIKESFEGNIMQLRNDLDKILAYANGKEIDKKTVDLLLTKTSTRHKFDLMDLIFEGRAKEASLLYNELVYKRVEPQEVLDLVGVRVREAFKYKVQLAFSRSEKEDMAALGERFSWLYQRKRETYSKISLANLNKIVSRLVDTEVRVKGTSTNVEREVELLILSIAGSIK